MIEVDCKYQIREDLEFILESEGINALELSEKAKISRTTIEAIMKTGKARCDVCERIYSYFYKGNYRLNSVKEELAKEKNNNVLFHGSRNGLAEVTATGSRDNCDFGKGFYLGETYNQALSFVCEKENSSVYSFGYSLEGLKTKRFDCDLDWMLAICYYRGNLQEYTKAERLNRIIEDIEESDAVIAPIADNKMFYIMSQFTSGDINANIALHSLSASKLGLQYAFRTDKAINNLVPIENYYISAPEREDCIRQLTQRSYEIDTKLKLAKREFKDGLYIEEILK